jgi:hypothetical protein
MVRLSVLGLAAYAAVCMAASRASAEEIYPPPPSITLDARDIDLRCYAVGDGTPWISHVARDYRIDLSHSSVNGEALQINEAKVVINVLGAKVRTLAWNRPADASVPAAHYVLNLRTNGIVVSFDDGESDGRKSAGAELQLRCSRRFLKYF